MNDEQMHRLIETVNNTARTAHTTMSLFLVVALYLLWILVSSTDEILFLNGQLVLGQLNISLSLKNSYIIGPLILFFMHIYFLILFQRLREKVARFEFVLQEVYPRETESKTWQEMRDRISSSVFVQSIQAKSNKSSRLLALLSIVAVPLGLLFAVDLSFVRYQSGAITLLHDVLFVTDLVLVAWFGINRKRWQNLYEFTKNTLIRLRIYIAKHFRRTEEQSQETYGHTGIPVPWTTLLFIGVSFIIASTVLFDARPPVFNHETVKEDQTRIWHEPHETGDVSRLRKIWNGILDVMFEDSNFLDAVPCKSYGIACRYLDVSTKELIRMSNRELNARVSEESEGENGIERFHSNVVDLSSRNLLFAKLASAWVQGGDFSGADLRGADLQGAHLGGTYFVRAELQGAKLIGTRLQNADLAGASAPDTNLQRSFLQGVKLTNGQLQGADLTKADLRDANIISARLQRADLTGTDLREARLQRTWLQGADLATAKLQHADLEGTQLQGARLSGASLQGANLSKAELQGANLAGAQLQGANLKGAKLQGTDLTRTQLEGADFANAELQGSFGKPDSWCLLWIPDADFEFSPLKNKNSQYELALDFVEKLLKENKDRNRSIRLTWRGGMSLEEHLEEYLWKGIIRGVFDGSEPGEECLVYHESRVTKWNDLPPDINSCDYQNAWVAWTKEFACENRYTAASSLDRWLSEEPLYEAKSRINNLDDLKRTVRDALALAKRKNEGKCPGLSSVSEDKYRKLVSARAGPLPTCESCAERPACAPRSRSLKNY